MKKLAIGILSTLLFASTYASQYMVVMCYMNPGVATSLPAAISDPNTGTMSMINGGCGPALAAVPTNYVLLSTSYAGMTSSAFVNYLFVARATD